MTINELVSQQLTVKDHNINSHSWASHIKQLLHDYGLPSAGDVLARPRKKVRWKKMVKVAAFKKRTEKLRDAAEEMSTMEFLNLQACSLGQLHPIRQVLHNPLSILKATARAQLFIKLYPLSTSHTSGSNKKDICPFSKQQPETTTHFLIHCNPTSTESWMAAAA